MAEVNEGVVIPGEEEGGASQSPDVREQRETAVKDAARAKGWKPLKEFVAEGGDAEEWVSAKEFVGRDKLYKKIHDLQNTLGNVNRKNESELKQIRKHFEQVREQEYQRAKRELQEERREAIAAGDVKEAERIEEKLDNLKDEQAEAKAQAAKEAAQAPAQQGPSPEFIEWQGRNKWFNVQEMNEATQVALEIGNAHAAANPHKSQAQVLEYVEKHIKKAFPERFQSQRKPGPPVEGGGSLRMASNGNEGSKKGKLTVADLNDMERSVLSTLIKTKALDYVAKKNKRTPTEEYLAELQNAYDRDTSPVNRRG